MFKWRRKSDSPATWTTTFADMTTLLLTFFVLLYSFSSLDTEKFKSFLISFQGQGILNWGDQPLNEVAEVTMEPSQNLVETTQSLLSQAGGTVTTEDVYKLANNFIMELGLEDEMQAQITEEGVALLIKDRILFDSGKADLKPEAKEILDPVAKLLGALKNEIWVEGHTDSRPIHTREFPTNWELSTARSSRVIRYFVEEKHLDPKRFVAIGYGEYRPVAPNTTWENMQQNRRVVIIIRTEDLEKVEVPTDE